MALSYLVGSVTQGSADAFAQSEIATALSGQTGRAFRIREIEFDVPPIQANGADIQVALSRRSQAAMPLITDRNVIAIVRDYFMITTSGATKQERIRRLKYSEDDNLLVVEDPLYFVIDSGSTSGSNTALVRIGYELVNISANDRLALALQSLNEA